MKIANVVEIFDNGEFVTLVTMTGSAIHLPMNAKHSIIVQKDEALDGGSVTPTFNVVVDLFEG